MRPLSFASFATLVCMLPAMGQAQNATGDDALMLLQKVATAGQKLNYSGVFVYQNGTRSETSRITHFIDQGSEFEKLEVLDGSPREVLRHNDEVRCFLPDNKLMIVERRSSRQLFPTLVPGSLATLTEYYQVRIGEIARVAGINSRLVHVVPKDEFRYGHQFWIEPNSGLLLRSSLIGEGGKSLETFAFTELRIGGLVGDMAKANAAPDSTGWQVQHVKASEVRADDGQWLFRGLLPGFRKISAMKRQLRPDAPESTQIVFSDGLAAISVFIEALGGRPQELPQSFSVGAVNVYKKQVADYQLIVMGDVPVGALRRFGDGVEIRRK